MVIIEFLGPIKREPLTVEVKDLKELYELFAKDSELREWIDNSAVAVNDEIIKDKEYKFKDGDKVSILPPVCGG